MCMCVSYHTTTPINNFPFFFHSIYLSFFCPFSLSLCLSVSMPMPPISLFLSLFPASPLSTSLLLSYLSLPPPLYQPLYLPLSLSLFNLLYLIILPLSLSLINKQHTFQITKTLVHNNYKLITNKQTASKVRVPSLVGRDQ